VAIQRKVFHFILKEREQSVCREKLGLDSCMQDIIFPTATPVNTTVRRKSEGKYRANAKKARRGDTSAAKRLLAWEGV